MREVFKSNNYLNSRLRSAIQSYHLPQDFYQQNSGVEHGDQDGQDGPDAEPDHAAVDQAKAG
jgi:hypothetical protein